MHRSVRAVLILITTIILMLGLFYIGLAYYYSHSFPMADSDNASVKAGERCYTYGTYINGIYATGMTPDQVEEEIEKNYELVDTAVIMIDGQSYRLSLRDMDYDFDFHEPLYEALRKQNPLLWGKALFGSGYSISVSAACSFDEEAFNEAFDLLSLDEVLKDSGEIYIFFDEEEGYELFDGKKNSYDIEAIRQKVRDSLSVGTSYIEIGDECRKDYEYTDKELRLIEYYELLKEKTDHDLSYAFGRERLSMKGAGFAALYSDNEIKDKITASMVNSDLSVNGIDFEVDEERARDFLTEYLDEYNTYHNKYFKCHDGSYVYVTAGNYGNEIDLDTEAKWLTDYLKGEHEERVRTPEYLHEANTREKDDFGDTYIEIDLDEQHMWYYVDGATYVDTNIVSGSRYNGSHTSPRVVYVYSIIPDKWLNGPTWHCFVHYWVAIQGSIGIHDASWRTAWDDSQYLKNNGSHGCINTPTEDMQKLFERVEVGTPVIVYSHEENGVKREE